MAKRALGNKLQWNFNWNSYIFIQENAFDNLVCEMAAILSRGRWVLNHSHGLQCESRSPWNPESGLYAPFRPWYDLHYDAEGFAGNEVLDEEWRPRQMGDYAYNFTDQCIIWLYIVLRLRRVIHKIHGLLCLVPVVTDRSTLVRQGSWVTHDNIINW